VPVSSTDRPIAPRQSEDGLSVTTYPVPRRLDAEEIPAVVDGFRIAARNAIEAGEQMTVNLHSDHTHHQSVNVH
jgi:12-oxophytodienoic acid reductase